MRVAATAAVVAGAAALVACGEETIAPAPGSPYRRGAELFQAHCSGCHTLDAAVAEGSATKVRDRERTDGPNFNVRHEQVNQVLYAIRNGGFSGAIMPQNVVTGQDAVAVAQFLAHYSGREASTPPAPTAQPSQNQSPSTKAPPQQRAANARGNPSLRAQPGRANGPGPGSAGGKRTK